MAFRRRVTTAWVVGSVSLLAINALAASAPKSEVTKAGGAQRRHAQLATKQHLEDLKIELAKGTILHGVVTDARGRPVAGAKVQLFDRSRPINLGPQRDRQPTSYETNALGEFSIANVGAETQRAYISHPTLGVKVVEDIVPALKSGEPLRATLVGPAEIEGFIYRGAKPVADGDVIISYAPSGGNREPRAISLRRAMKTDDRGFFSFEDLPAGRYQVAHSKRWKRSNMYVRTTFTEVKEGGASFVVLGGGGGAVLGGTIKGRTGGALAGVTVSIDPIGSWQDSVTDITGTDGKYEIWDLAPGRYQLRVSRFRPLPGGG